MYNRLIAGYEHTNNSARRPTGSSGLIIVEDNYNRTHPTPVAQAIGLSLVALKSVRQQHQCLLGAWEPTRTEYRSYVNYRAAVNPNGAHRRAELATWRKASFSTEVANTNE
jgi:hypothetical protein